MKRYKVIMEGINPRDNLVMGTGLTIEQARELKKKCKEEDYLHYYEIYLMGGDK